MNAIGYIFLIGFAALVATTVADQAGKVINGNFTAIHNALRK